MIKRLLLEGKNYARDIRILRKTALNLGWEIQRIFNYSYEDDGAKPILYGSSLLAPIIEKACNVKFVYPDFDWLTTLPEKYTKRKIKYYTRENIQWPEEKAFIKCCDIKWFKAGVYEPIEMKELFDLVDESGVLISEPVKFNLEFRAFILNNKITTISPYMQDEIPLTEEEDDWFAFSTEEAEVVLFLNEMLDDENVKTPSSLVIDIGYIENKGWAVIEANESWYSGIYACEPVQVLKTIEGAVVKNYSHSG
jgi:hypothetical protein